LSGKGLKQSLTKYHQAKSQWKINDGSQEQAARQGTIPTVIEDSRVYHPLALYHLVQGSPPPKTGGEIVHDA
jgi:hypothetical protein